MAFGSPQWMYASGEDFTLDQGLRFNAGGSAHLSRTPASAGNRRTFTWSGWVKRGPFSTTAQHALFSAGPATNDFTMFYINKVYSGQPDGALTFFDFDGSTMYGFAVNARMRDPAAWYHVVYSVDTTQGTAADRVKIYINNQLVSGSVFSDYGTIPEDHQTHVNNTQAQYIGRYQTNAQYFDGYLAEVHFIDGTARPPSDFAETNSTTNQWVPKEYDTASGAYGTNGYYLKFVSGAIGTDSSGEGNNWTAVNLANSDVMPDTPTNNFCTLNTVGGIGGNNTYRQGNLRFYNNSTSNYDTGACSTFGTMAIDTSDSTGWYWEFLMEDLGREDLQWNGIIKASATTGTTYASQDGDIVRSFSWNGAGKIMMQQPQDTTNSADSTNPDTDGAHIGFALKNNKMWVRMNGTWYGDPAANTPSAPEVGIPLHINIPDGHWLPFFLAYGGFQSYGTCAIVANFGQNGTFSGNTTAGGNSDANGYGDFKYSVPSGFLALCSKNLPDPTIKLPGEHFNTVLWTGTGAVDHDITGVGFQPDFAWFKARNLTEGHMLFDAVRGTAKTLFSNNSGAENTSYTNVLSAFNADGYTLGSNEGVNHSSGNYVAWNWKANGSGSANTAGSRDTTATRKSKVFTVRLTR